MGRIDEEGRSLPALDWPGKDPETLELGRVRHFDFFLEGLREVVPEGSILALEGKPVAEVRSFLETVKVAPRVRISRNTVWPKHDFFHVPATRSNLDKLLDFTLEYALPEICDHVVLYKDLRVLLWLHDAGDGYVYGDKRLGPEAIERLRSRLIQK